MKKEALLPRTHGGARNRDHGVKGSALYQLSYASMLM